MLLVPLALAAAILESAAVNRATGAFTATRRFAPRLGRAATVLNEALLQDQQQSHDARVVQRPDQFCEAWAVTRLALSVEHYWAR